MKRIVMTAVLVLFAVGSTMAQNFQNLRQPQQGVPYESFICVQPKQKKLTTVLNVLSVLFSQAQGLSSSRRFNQGIQYGLMGTGVAQQLQASRASPSLICYASVPTGSYESISQGRIP